MKPRKKVAIFYKEWSDSVAQIVEGVFSLPEVRQRCELRNFPQTRSGTGLHLPSGWSPDGILFALDEGDPRVGQLGKMGVPVVRMGAEWANDPFPAATVDLLTFAKQALGHFEKLSLDKVLFVGRKADSRTPRISALLRRLAPRFNIRLVQDADIGRVSFGVSRAVERLSDHPEFRSILNDMPGPYGVVSLWAWDAVFLLNACPEANLRVPQDAAVLSGEDTMMVQLSDPPISALVVDRLEIGRRAIGILERLMAGQAPKRKYERVPFTSVNARPSTLGESPLDQSIERVRRMINERACEGITVEEIMGHLDMSRPTMEKRYRELSGVSPAFHIRQLRGAKARELLLTTKLSVTQVARRVGFDDPRPFMVFFKREFGQTPGAFRDTRA